MSEPLSFLSIRIEAFRGFRDSQEVRLDGSAVILTGANGTGKTSLVDAIQWLLLGKLERLEPLRVHRNEEHIVNRYRLPGPATVEADVQVNGRALTLRRAGRYDSSILEVFEGDAHIQGDEAERFLKSAYLADSPLTMRSALLTSALLQQDVMRELLEASAAERYRYLNELLDLGVVERFESAAKDRFAERQTQVKQVEDQLRTLLSERDARLRRLETLEAQLRSRPGTVEVWNQLTTLLEEKSSSIMLPLPPRSVAELQHMLAGISATRARLDGLLEEGNALFEPSELANRPNDAQMNALREEFQVAAAAAEAGGQNVAAAREEERLAASASEAYGRLASYALALLSETCPVCEQQINPHTVAEKLRSRAEDVSVLVEVRQRRELVERSYVEAQERLESARRELELAESHVRQFVAANQRISDWLTRFASMASESEFLVVEEIPSDVARGKDRLSGLVTDLRAVESALQATISVLQSVAEAQEVETLRSELRQTGLAVEELEARVDGLRKHQLEAKDLVRASREAAVRVVDQRFSVLRPLVNDIYSRLDPHPSFKELDLDHEVYRSRGATKPVVKDPSLDVEANPSLVFSTSQANIAALSYFLGLGWAAGERALPFICLDDPLQSMDDVNVLAFADLCRFIRSQRQLIISTHEQRFAKLLERKLAPREHGQRTLVASFGGWDRSGPNISIREVKPQLEAQQLTFVRSA